MYHILFVYKLAVVFIIIVNLWLIKIFSFIFLLARPFSMTLSLSLPLPLMCWCKIELIFQFFYDTIFRQLIFFFYLNIDVVGAPPQWTGLKTATNLSSVCPQNLPTLNKGHQHLSNGRYEQLKRMLSLLTDESEDCLYLNLYVPKWCKCFIFLIYYSEASPSPIKYIGTNGLSNQSQVH